MPKQIYNEGRVVGLSAYESYVRRKLADDENAIVASEREWLASTLGMGASLLLHVDANTQMTVPSSSSPGLRYCDFPFPKSSKLGAASTIIMSFFDGTGDFNLQDAIVNASTAYSLSGKKVVLTNSPILKRKTSLTLKFTNPSAGSITIDDSKSLDGELSSKNFVRCRDIISTNPYNARFYTSVTLPDLVIDTGLAAIKGEQFKLYGVDNTVLFYDDGAGHLISEADGSVVATTVYNDDGVTIKSFTDIQPDYSLIGIHGISYNTYLDIYISGKLDFATRKITISVDSRSTDIKYADYGVTFGSSSATLINNNITSGNISVAYSYYTYETNTLWADRVTSYGRLLNNSTASASPSTPGDTKSRTPIGSLIPLTKYVGLTSSNIASLVGGDWENGPADWATEYNTKYYTRSGSSPNYKYTHNTKSNWETAKSQTLYVFQLEDELKQMMDYLKIADAIIIQPGEWTQDDEIASPYKDFKPGYYIHNPPILRIYFTNEIKNSFNILLTGFVDKDVVIGESDLTSAIDTASPENGDFLGPAAYPWAAKIIVTTPTELSYYLKNSIRSGSQNVVITQTDDSPEVAIAVKNKIDRGTKEQIEGAVKHSDMTDSQLPVGYTGKNVHVGQSDDSYPEDTKIGVKNVITAVSRSSDTNPPLRSDQTNDGAETLLTINPFATVSDVIVAGPGISFDPDPSKGKITINNTIVQGNYSELAQSRFNMTWYNNFYSAPMRTNPTGQYADHTNSLHIRYIINYIDPKKTPASAKNSYDNISSIQLRINTNTDNYAIQNKKALAYYTVDREGHGEWYNNVEMRHSVSYLDEPKSKICRLRFNDAPFNYLNALNKDMNIRKPATIQMVPGSSKFSGIWNVGYWSGTYDSNDPEGFYDCIHECGASWTANCTMDRKSAMNSAGTSQLDSESGIVLSIAQYSDGINSSFSALGKHCARIYSGVTSGSYSSSYPRGLYVRSNINYDETLLFIFKHN